MGSEDFSGAAPPAPGTEVTFTVGTNNKGKLRALMIQERGGAKRRRVEVAPRPEKDNSALEEAEGSTFEGEALSWKSPWGWVRVEGMGDLFAHKEDVNTGDDLAPGAVVQFVVGRDPKKDRFRALET